ncbi:MAG TPA: hypothetical protein VGR21_08920 [Cryptosporangiaceae bacterium]|nr:hypothetical protein [Cryptosporangiaceae bacterium]
MELRCGAPTRRGTPCRNVVAEPGPCRLHADEPPVPPLTVVVPAEGPADGPHEVTADEAARRQRLARAAAICTDLVADGAYPGVEDLAGRLFDDATWTDLRDRWQPANCVVVTAAARQALGSPTKMHSIAATLAEQAWRWMGRPKVEQFMVRELVKRLPIVGEGQIRATARAAQLTGIHLCLARGHELADCPAFVDIVVEEGELQPRRLLRAARDDWSALSRLG